MLSDVVGGAGLKAFWYHFAIMFEALFILTTVDAGTRVARFMLSDSIGNIPGARKFRDPSWRVGAWTCSLLVVLAWGAILLMGVTDPLGGINTLFPLFGIANQLLAAIALTVVFTVLIKKRMYKWAWIPGVPLVWDLIVTLTASYQKIFSPVPAIGYFAQHNAFAAGAGRGRADVRHRDQPGGDRCRHPQHPGAGHAVDRLRRAGHHRGARRDRGVRHGPSARAACRPPKNPTTPSHLFAPSSFLTTPAEKQVAAEWAKSRGRPGALGHRTWLTLSRTRPARIPRVPRSGADAGPRPPMVDRVRDGRQRLRPLRRSPRPTPSRRARFPPRSSTGGSGTARWTPPRGPLLLA